MTQKWKTKGKGEERKHILIDNSRKVREVQVTNPGPSAKDLERRRGICIRQIRETLQQR